MRQRRRNNMEKEKFNTDIFGRIQEFKKIVLGELDFKRKMYRTLFKTTSFEFDGFREYSSSYDNVRDIDWKASVRTQKLLVRKYKIESEQKVLFVLDTSDNMVFGSQNKLKCEYAAEVVGVLSDVFINDGNFIGLFIYNSNLSKFIPPKKGKAHFYFIISTILDTKNYGGYSDLDGSLNFLKKIDRKRISCVVILSDFLSYRKEKHFHDFNLISKKFESIAVVLRDPLDTTLPVVRGEFVIQDPRTGEQKILDPSIARFAYESFSKYDEEVLIKDFFDCGIDVLRLNTSESFIPNLFNFLKFRLRY
ncbi:MAG: DUF58 domain-containing protein [Candidatus Pacearchaeota archaeon]